MRYRAWRYPCHHPVDLTAAGRQSDATLLNVSAQGARIASPVPLDPGDPLTIALGPGCPPRAAVVRWVRPGTLGVEFTRALDARTIAVIRKTAGHRGFHGAATPARPPVPSPAPAEQPR
ncbi:MAG: PilZ domain-containing protein [Rhodobacteraceae bacterium]|nr:PilZ domain-containing protein [Paracoccaceae bacterium]